MLYIILSISNKTLFFGKTVFSINNRDHFQNNIISNLVLQSGC